MRRGSRTILVSVAADAVIAERGKNYRILRCSKRSKISAYINLGRQILAANTIRSLIKLYYHSSLYTGHKTMRNEIAVGATTAKNDIGAFGFKKNAGKLK